MRITSRLTLATGVAVLFSFAAAPMVHAIESADTTTPEQTTSNTGSTVSSDDGSGGERTPAELKQKAEKRIAEAKAKAADIKAAAEERKAQREKAGEKLTAAKQRICERHQTVITNVMSRINNRGQKHLELINTVSTRVQEFKNSKDLTVANYDALLAAVESSKVAAQTAVDAVKNTQVEFACDGTDPKGVGASFKEALKAQNDALKVYRDAVKDLVTAVKQAAQTAKDDSTTNQDQEAN